MEKYDVLALGELLIDFTEHGASGQGNPVLEANPGGAPCNVLAMLKRLGKRTGFIGKVGNDMFGSQLEDALREVGIDTRGLKRDKEVHTTLAFVHTGEDGDREFSFYRNPGADMMLTESDLDAEMLGNCRIFHFGTLSMTHERCREATRKAISIAESGGALLSFDPNLREPLWENLEDARERIFYGLQHCQILKISDNEIQWLTGKEDFDEGILVIQEKFHTPLILLSMGRAGSRAYQKGICVEEPAYIQENTIETTGAGDTFHACILNYILEHGWKEFEEAELKEMLRFANAAAALITTRKGALRVMPEKKEVEVLVRQRGV
ncbi:MAG: carbohydrate kinase [Lachnospiraceae bacterium]|nr:carbohydrate kinase [Lachnospiraceae bacterium]